MDVSASENSKLFRYKKGSNLYSRPFKEVTSGARDLHLARTSEMAELKSELLDARKLAEDLASRVEETKVRVRARRERIELGGELEEKKREVSNLRLKMASILAEKERAEETRKAAQARENLEKEINEVDEEHVLVELARIEAIREAKEMEERRKEEERRHTQKLKDSKARVAEMKKKLANARKLDEKLSVTMADIVVLKREMVFVRAMEKKKNEKKDAINKSSSEEDAEDEMRSAMAELEIAKKELDSVEELRLKYISSMDTIRKKVGLVPSRSWKLQEEETEARIRNLNTELVKANGELKATSSLEKRRKDIVSNLTIALANLNKDKDKATEETKRVEEETKHHQERIRRNISKIDDAKQGLLVVMHELKRIKSSEAATLGKLRQLCERTSKKLPRASRAMMVTQFEHEYLKKCGEGAREVAKKKVEAAKAWVEALGSSEKEVRLEIERVVRESEGLEGGTEREEEAEREREEEERLPVSREEGVEMVEPRRRSVKEKPRRRSSVHVNAPVRKSSLTLRNRRRRKKVVKNLAKLLGGKDGIKLINL